MRQLVIARCRQAWGTEYSLTDFKTKKIVLCAIHNSGLKSWIDAYEAGGALSFTIRCRDLFGLTYDVVDADGGAMGVLERESWLSPLLRVKDTPGELMAQIVRVLPSLYEEFSLDLDQQTLCLFRRADNFSTPLICCCLDESQISLDLMLSAGILILGQGISYGSDGAA